MKYSKDIGFAVIHRNKEINNEITHAFRNAFRVNKKFFRNKPRKFSIIICNTEQELKDQAKYYYQPWLTATVLRNCTLVSRSPEFVAKVGRWKRKDFQSIMNHEVSHVFWLDFYGITKPVWFSEGLANHIGKNMMLPSHELARMMRKHHVNHSLLDYRYLKRKFNLGHIPRYPVWDNFTRYLSRRFGDKKLLQFLSVYMKKQTKKNYANSFIHIFGSTDKRLFSEFQKAIKRGVEKGY